jgi:hypothetical protein
MPCVVLRGRWFNIIVLNMYAPSDEKSDEAKDRFYEDLVQVFYHFLKCHIKILLQDFNAKLERQNIFKPTIGNDSLHQDSNDNGVIIVNFDTSKILIVTSTMFPHRSFHKFNWTSPDPKLTSRLNTY